MATKELLLSILVTVIVAISIAVAVQIINSGEISPNRTQVIQEINTVIGRARGYYERMELYGGGQNSFEGITFSDLAMDSVNQFGTFSISNVTQSSFRFSGQPSNSDEVLSVIIYRDSVVWE